MTSCMTVVHKLQHVGRCVLRAVRHGSAHGHHAFEDALWSRKAQFLSENLSLAVCSHTTHCPDFPARSRFKTSPVTYLHCSRIHGYNCSCSHARFKDLRASFYSSMFLHKLKQVVVGGLPQSNFCETKLRGFLSSQTLSH